MERREISFAQMVKLSFNKFSDKGSAVFSGCPRGEAAVGADGCGSRGWRDDSRFFGKRAKAKSIVAIVRPSTVSVQTARRLAGKIMAAK